MNPASFRLRLTLALLIGYAWHLAFEARADHAPRAVLPKAIADLRTHKGLALVQGQWRYSDTVKHAIDGVKVDERGNVHVSGPGGLWIFDAAGRPLGTLRGPEDPHNMAWGDADRHALYLTAQTGIYRLRLNIAGAGAWPKSLEGARR